MREKKGEILIENVIFIILNVVFISVLILFLARQGSGAIILEEKHSKEIALILDAGEPGMTIKINMEKAFKRASSNGVNAEEIVQIDNSKNLVRVKLSEDSWKEYGFFNDVSASAYPEGDGVNYIIKINEYKIRK